MTDTADEVPLVPNAAGLLTQIDAHHEPTASNMMIVWTQIIRMLCSIPCGIPHTGKWNYAFIMFSMPEFLLQKGIRQEAVPAIEAVAAADGVAAVAAREAIPVGPGTAYVLPTDPGEPPNSGSAASVAQYTHKLKAYYKYEQVVMLARTALKQAYPTGDQFLSMEDAYGCIHDHPLAMYKELWDNSVGQEDKDQAIIDNQKALMSTYDPGEPVNVFFSKIQLAMEILSRLAEPVTERNVIRHCVAEFRTHADLSRSCRKWTEEQEDADPSWEEFKSFFGRAIKRIQNDPSTKRRLDMANSVQESVATNSTDIQTMAGALIPLKDTITTLEKEIAALKMTTQAPLANAATTPSAYDQLLEKYENYKRSNPSNGGRGGRGGGRGGGRSAGRGGRGGRGTDGARTYVKHRNDLPDIQGWGKERSQRNNPDSNEWCHSCGFDVIHNSTNCRHRLDGHDATAVWTDRTRLPTSGSPRNCHFIVSPS